MKRALPRGWYNIAHYNDYLQTTRVDVLAVYDRAIVLAWMEGV